MANYISNYSGDFSSFAIGKLTNSIQIFNHTDQIKLHQAYDASESVVLGFFSTNSPYLGYESGLYNFQGKITPREANFNKLTFFFYTDIKKIVFDGNIKIDLTTDAQTGYYSHVGILMDSGERFDIYGNAKYGSNIFNISSLTYKSAENDTLSLKGQIKLRGTDSQLIGKISSLSYQDSEGHKYTVSGLNVNINSLYAQPSLIDSVKDLMSGNDKTTGTKFADIMNGFGGADTLIGAAGIDTLIGGEGDDTYVQDMNAMDEVQEEADGGNDTYQFTNSNLSQYTPIDLNLADYSNIESLTVAGKGLFNLLGDSNHNKLTGNASANSISGGAGDDTLVGGGGLDTLAGGDGNDTYVIGSLNDVFDEGLEDGDSDTIDIAYKNTTKKAVSLVLSDYTNFENLSVSGAGLYNLTGDANDNILKGSASANVIDGNGGEDTMDGGGGNDTYYVDSAGDVTGELLAGKAGGIDTVYASFTHTLGSNIEKLILTGTENINGTGSASNNLILGNSRDNIIDGGAGVDTLKGGEGNDTYYVDNEKDQIIDVDVGTTIFSTSLNYTLSKEFTSITLIGSGNINASGNDKDNLITGNIGNNILNGGKGLDTLIGGLGDDTYILDMNSMDEVHETVGGGNDTYQFTNNNLSKSSPITLNVADYLNIESLAVVGKGLFNLVGDSNHNKLTGNASANSLSGGAGNDTLNGGAGNDTIDGGSGDDYYFADSQGDIVTEAVDAGNDTLVIAYANARKQALTLKLSDYLNFENLVLSSKGLFNLTGDDQNNLLTGNNSANNIVAGAGNDTLIGAGGKDTLSGGLGDDVYYISSTAAMVSESADFGNDTVWFSFDNTVDMAISLTMMYSNVEKYGLAGVGKFNLTGNEQNNYLIGNASDNILDGGFGSDTLEGAAGNDIYFVDESTDLISDSAGQDFVYSSANSYTLGAGVESIELLGTSNINAMGNELHNIITGNTSENVLSGGDGNDTINGGGGNDTFIGGLGDDSYWINASLLPTTLVLDGNSGDYVSGGNDYSFTNETGSFMVSMLDATGDGIEDILTISYHESRDGGHWFYLTFSTKQLGTNLSVGTYLNAQRAYFESSGHAGLDISGDGRGSNTLTGNFEIQEINIDYSSSTPVLLSFSATFEQHGDFSVSGLNGIIRYKAIGDLRNQIIELPDQGNDLINSTTSYTLTDNVERLTLLGSDNLTGKGNALDNVITGNSGENFLDGGQGNDTLIGGEGNDIYIVDAEDIVSESANHGIDTINASVNYSLASNLDVENLTLTGISNLSGIGNALNNILNDNSGNNILDGGEGEDTLISFDGNDMLIGGSGDDVLMGGSGADTLKGGSGDDTYWIKSQLPSTVLILDGSPGEYVSGGKDYYFTDATGEFHASMSDRTGDELVDDLSISYMEPGSGHWFFLDFGTYKLGANLAVGTYLNAERVPFAQPGHPGLDVYGDGVGSNTLTGSFVIQEINIDYSSGIPVMLGFSATFEQHSGYPEAPALKGTIRYHATVDPDNQVIELADQGNDLIYSPISYSLTDNIEGLTLLGNDNLSGTGNELDNVITGNSGDNVLGGGVGDDTLIGGAGNDIFVFDKALNGMANVDQITDFSISETIQLSHSIFSTLAVGSLSVQDFVSGSNAVALDNSDRIVFDTNDGGLYYDADGNGEVGMVKFAVLSGSPTLSANDFLVI